MMLNLPNSKLGEATAITIHSKDLEESLSFYQKLGFRELYRFDFPYPFIQITDGTLIIMLSKQETPFMALTFYTKDIDTVAAQLESNHITFIQKPREFDHIHHYSFNSPDGMFIQLVTYLDGFYKPEGPAMLKMSHDDYFNPEKYVNKVSGMFGELAIPVSHLETSIVFWESIGFKTMSKNAAPYAWAILTDGLATIGLHETDRFKQPTITFFASDMHDKIENISASGISDITIGSKGNGVLITPEQQRINLFNLSN